MLSSIGLQTLIDPVSPEDFLAHWFKTKQPLLMTRNQPAHFDGLLSIADVDRLFEQARPHLDDVRAANDSDVYQFLVDDPMHPDLLQQLYVAYNSGYTINLQNLQKYWPPVSALCQSLQSEIHHPIRSEMFFAPRTRHGFNPHWDPTDSFALQLSGRKHWRLHPIRMEAPFHSGTVSRDDLGEPIFEAILSPGDSLYVPWGMVHDVSPVDGPSLHVSIDIFAIKWCDILRDTIDRIAQQTPTLRAALPPGYLHDSQQRELLCEGLLRSMRLMPAAGERDL